MTEDDFKSMPYEKIIERKNKTSIASDDHVKAEIELYRLQKEQDDKNYAVLKATENLTKSNIKLARIIIYITVGSFLAFAIQAIR